MHPDLGLPHLREKGWGGGGLCVGFPRQPPFGCCPAARGLAWLAADLPGGARFRRCPQFRPQGGALQRAGVLPTFRATPAFIWLARLINLAVDDPARRCSGQASWGAVCWRRSPPPSRSNCGSGQSLLAPVWLLVLALPLPPRPWRSPACPDGPALAAWLARCWPCCIANRPGRSAARPYAGAAPSYFGAGPAAPLAGDGAAGQPRQVCAPHRAGGASLPCCLSGRPTAGPILPRGGALPTATSPSGATRRRPTGIGC